MFYRVKDQVKAKVHLWGSRTQKLLSSGNTKRRHGRPRFSFALSGCKAALVERNDCMVHWKPMYARPHDSATQPNATTVSVERQRRYLNDGTRSMALQACCTVSISCRTPPRCSTSGIARPEILQCGGTSLHASNSPQQCGQRSPVAA